MTTKTIETPEQIAFHEAGHALMYRLLRGRFQPDAAIMLTETGATFDAGRTIGSCRSDRPTLGPVCNEGYCMHEVWEDLAGPVTEWRYLTGKGLLTEKIFPWLIRHSTTLEAQHLADWDDLTKALRNYCEECLAVDNTPATSKQGHSNQHALIAMEREARSVEACCGNNWDTVEKISRAFLQKVRLDEGDLTVLTNGLSPINFKTFKDAIGARDGDEGAMVASD
jgi:hypothetical protein